MHVHLLPPTPCSEASLPTLFRLRWLLRAPPSRAAPNACQRQRSIVRKANPCDPFCGPNSWLRISRSPSLLFPALRLKILYENLSCYSNVTGWRIATLSRLTATAFNAFLSRPCAPFHLILMAICHPSFTEASLNVPGPIGCTVMWIPGYLPNKRLRVPPLNTSAVSVMSSLSFVGSIRSSRQPSIASTTLRTFGPQRRVFINKPPRVLWSTRLKRISC
jgi:hypothetical protein